jgi:hypothetical protein
MVESRERLPPDERERRRVLLTAVGTLLYGEAWHKPLAAALVLAGHDVQRQRILHWALAPNPEAYKDKTSSDPSKPIPAWAVDALHRIAREGAARRRAEADALDRLVAGGEPPAPIDETPPTADAASGAASAFPPEDEPDPLALVGAMLDDWTPPGLDPDSDFPRYEPPAPPPPREGWRSRFAESHGYR